MKRILKILAIVVVVLIVILIAIPFFIDANAFRPRLESDLTDALRRQVKVGNLSLSLFSGSVSADDISIADDPAFSQNPFIRAKSLRVGVELMPLIFSRTLNVTDLSLSQPEINLVKSENGDKWNFSNLGQASTPQSTSPKAAKELEPQREPKGKAAKELKSEPKTEPKTEGGAQPSASVPPNLSVAKLNVNDGRLTVARAGTGEKPRVYDKVNISVTDFSFASSFPFKMTADLPGGGNLHLDGKAGPIDANDAALTPLDAKVTIKEMKLADSGFIDPASGISGTADFDGAVTSSGHEAKTEGTLTATNLKLVPKGSPAGRAVQVNYSATYNLVQQAGNVPKCDVAMGKAVAHLNGNYNAHGRVTTVNMKLEGQGMPVDELEAMIPALGIVLPPKAELKGGTISTNLTIDGPVDRLIIKGPVKMENTALANFDLGSRLSSIAALSGKSTGNTTTIQNLSSDVKVAPEGTQADNINLNVPTIGVLTGAGTVSPRDELAFKMQAAVAGLNVPFTVSGTTSDPRFAPDVKGLASSFAKGALGNQGKSVLDLFNKKKPK